VMPSMTVAGLNATHVSSELHAVAVGLTWHH